MTIFQAVPFEQRLLLFKALLDENKAQYAASHSFRHHVIPFQRIHRLRHRLLLDAFHSFSAYAAATPGYTLQPRVQVEFVSAVDTVEAGIDGGGIFKEFLELFAQALAAEEMDLFAVTDRQELLPSRSRGGGGLGTREGVEAADLYRFVGMMVAKALYEVRRSCSSRPLCARSPDLDPPSYVSPLLSSPMHCRVW